jgi:hypothetical protein
MRGRDFRIYFDHDRDVWLWKESVGSDDTAQIVAADKEFLREVGIRWDDEVLVV